VGGAEERKVATVLFADLVGSTELGEQDPERTRALLIRFYDAMAEAIEQAGGTVEKFIGDAVMAAFGAPVAQEDHAERALHTALEMQQRFRALFGEGLELRIGVNTGDVVVGAAREGGSFVTGDAVNVGARLEQSAAPGEIVVGERTVQAVRGAFEFDERAVIAAKGKREGVPCRRLLRALSLQRPRGIRGLDSVLVGRDSELAMLEQAYESAVEAGRPWLVTIVGDSGVGKTRLVREFWQLLAGRSPQPLRRTGRCVAYGRGVTYLPLAEVLREQLGVAEGEPADALLRRLHPRQILGLAFGLDVGEDLHPLVARERLQQAWVDLVEELAAARPMVLAVEDVHWAEEPLLDLLERLYRDARVPLLLLVTARPEFLEQRARWGTAAPRSTLVRLDALEDAETARLVDLLLASDLPRDVRELVVRRAEGNPFFVEELLGTLIDRGFLVRVSDGWRIESLPSGFALPDSITTLIEARIDLLPPAEKAALQAAAVIGRTFWTGPLYDALGELEPDLLVLEDRDFIRRRPRSALAGEREYVFKHALTQEVAYGSLPKARRAELHATFARWLESHVADDEHAALLAHHFAEAVRPEHVDLAWPEGAVLQSLRGAAVQWLQRAGDLAMARYELEDAVELFHRALPLVVADEERSTIWRRLARAHALGYDGEAFEEATQHAISLCRDRETLAQLHAHLALETVNRSGMWRRRPSPKVVERAAERALELAEPSAPARVRALVAKVLLDPERNGELAVEADALAEELGSDGLRSLTLDARAEVALVAGRYEEALAFGRARLELPAGVDDPAQAYVYYDVLQPAVLLGRFDEGRRLARRFGEAQAPLTPHHRMHGVSVPLEVEALASDWTAVGLAQDRVVAAVEENAATPCVRNVLSLLLCAAAKARLGDVESASELGDRAERLEMVGYDDILNPARIRLALFLGDLAEVERLLAESPRAFRRGRGWFSALGAPARLDSLAALGDREGVEAEADPLLEQGTCLEPYALRALGVVRADDALVERAAELFEAMTLSTAASETRDLLVRT
jgi:class 3 adenylate cyclase/tetratricopeptide (TPR) repeat protein